MAQIYVDEDTKKRLDELASKEHRALADEVRFLVDTRTDELKKKKGPS